MLPPHSTVVLVQLLAIGLLDATYTAFKVPISFALPYNLRPSSVNCIVDELTGKSNFPAAICSAPKLCIS